MLQINEKPEDDFIGEYAELKETPTRKSLEMEGASVSRAKFDNIKEVLKKVQVS